MARSRAKDTYHQAVFLLGVFGAIGILAYVIARRNGAGDKLSDAAAWWAAMWQPGAGGAVTVADGGDVMLYPAVPAGDPRRGGQPYDGPVIYPDVPPVLLPVGPAIPAQESGMTRWTGIMPILIEDPAPAPAPRRTSGTGSGGASSSTRDPSPIRLGTA